MFDGLDIKGLQPVNDLQVHLFCGREERTGQEIFTITRSLKVCFPHILYRSRNINTDLLKFQYITGPAARSLGGTVCRLKANTSVGQPVHQIRITFLANAVGGDNMAILFECPQCIFLFQHVDYCSPMYNADVYFLSKWRPSTILDVYATLDHTQGAFGGSLSCCKIFVKLTW